MDRKKLLLLKTVVRFTVYFVVSLAALLILFRQTYMSDFVNMTMTYMVFWMAKIIGIEVYTSGNTVYGNGFGVVLASSCNGAFIISLFASAVVSYPSTLKHKLMGLLAGIPLLFVLNVIRAFILFLLVYHSSDWFETVHKNVGPNLLIFAVVIQWLFWAGACRKRSFAG